MAHRNLALIVVLLICLTFSACGGQSTPHPPATETKVVPTWTDMPQPTDTPKPTARPSVSLKVLQPANLRSGPGMDYPIVGGRQAGDCVVSDRMNADKTWYHLVSNAWIFAKLVKSAPSCSPPPTNTPRPPGLPSGCFDWTTAREYVGASVCLCGPVVSTKYASTSNGQPTFLNIGGGATNSSRLTIVIWGNNRSNFPTPPEDTYRGANICVTGKVKLYKDVPEIEAAGPTQIVVN